MFACELAIVLISLSDIPNQDLERITISCQRGYEAIKVLCEGKGGCEGLQVRIE